MKKPPKMRIFSYTRTLLTLMLIVAAFTDGVVGQIMIDAGDMPSPGDTIRISSALNTDFYNFEETGENFTWDYSNLTAINQRVDTFINVTETPVFYWPFFIFSANLASPLVSDPPIPEIPLTDVFNFYNNTSDNFKDVGFAATLSGLPLPFKFDIPDIVYEFPMNYGNTDSSFSGLSVGLENIGFLLIDRKRVNTVDGWGQLISPYGTFDVLRLKSEVYEYDSIYVDSISVGFPLEREYVEYKWLAKQQKIPLLTISTASFNLLVDYVDSLRTEVTNVPEKFADNEVKIEVYPNPVSESLTIEIDENINETLKLFLLDLQGRILVEKSLNLNNSKTIHLNLNKLNLKPGTFLIQIASNNFVKTIRIVFNKNFN